MGVTCKECGYFTAHPDSAAALGKCAKWPDTGERLTRTWEAQRYQWGIEVKLPWPNSQACGYFKDKGE